MNTRRSQRRLKRLIEQVARADVRGRAVPIFVSPALNRACIRRADQIRLVRSRRKWKNQKEKLHGTD